MGCQCVLHLYHKTWKTRFLFVYAPLRLFSIWKIKIFLWGKILGYAAITSYVLTCSFNGSILFSHLLMFPEGFLVLVKIKMVGEGGIFLFLMYPVLKLEICPVACKRKRIIFERKKKSKVLLVSLFHPLR